MFKYLKKILDMNSELGIPSMDMLVYQDGKEVFHEIRGCSDTNNTPLNGNELYNIYSCSKPITCVTALTLFEQGKFSLEDNIADYIPAFKDMMVKKNGGIFKAEKPIKIKNLFTMTAGLNYNCVGKALAPEIKQGILDTEGKCPTLKMMDYIAKMPLEYEPGERWMYSLAHDVIAALVEVVSGKRFGEYLKEKILEPNGIKDITYLVPENELGRVCEQFNHVDGQFIPHGKLHFAYKFGSEYESGGAGATTSTRDYVKFLEALRTGKILSPDTVALMKEDRLTEELRKFYWLAEGYGYGLGVRVPSNHLRTDYGWGGAAGAFAAVDEKNKISLFYSQHVFNTPNKDWRKDIIEAAKLDLGCDAFKEDMFHGIGNVLA